MSRSRAILFWLSASLTAIQIHAYYIPNQGHRHRTTMYNDRRGRGRGSGRGEYYKQKYGKRRAGAEAPSSSHGGSSSQRRRGHGGSGHGGSYETLLRVLKDIDHKSYPAYRDLETSEGWVQDDTPQFTLWINKVQSDPYAPPTRIRIQIPKPDFPQELFENSIRRIALADYLLRKCYTWCSEYGDAMDGGRGGGWSGPKGGTMRVLKPTQQVLEQSALCIQEDGGVILQLSMNLPARGRTILGHVAQQLFQKSIPALISECVLYNPTEEQDLQRHVYTTEDQSWLRDQLPKQNLIAFIPDGAILPRNSGDDDTPLTGDDGTPIPFMSPPSHKHSFALPNSDRTIHGMGIPRGITLIVGGGFHGKSTLLHAIQQGIYDHIPGDGREFCVSGENTVKIRAEDGRCVHDVNISSFIDNLPFGKQTKRFCSRNASGSTSQASFIMEAMEMNATALLFDEDTCATNFMIRDYQMSQLIPSKKEPITPFIRKVRTLYDVHGISTILVIGGCGDYFHVSDNVFQMDEYRCLDVTDRAKAIASGSHVDKSVFSSLPLKDVTPRHIVGRLFQPDGKVSVRSQYEISYGQHGTLNMHAMEQLVGVGQSHYISQVIQKMSSSDQKTFEEALETFDKEVKRHGLQRILSEDNFHGELVYTRKMELAGAMNRLRSHGCLIQDFGHRAYV